MKTVVVQGLGFVGAATAVAVANAKNKNGKPNFKVYGIDLPTNIGIERVNKINLGVFPFETNDQKIVSACKNANIAGNLSATTDSKIISKADIILVNVNLDLYFNTNLEPLTNLKTFKKAISTIGEYIKKGALIIVETTVPPGTCEKIVKPLIELKLRERNIPVDSVFIAHSYERVMPGSNYLDSIINFWRVYSGINDKAAKLCKNFLSKIINVKDFPLIRLSSTTASETAKVLENSYRAVNIAFIEEWSRFAEDSGIDLFEIIKAIRVRPTHSNIRQPGFGVGGYCLTKDPLFAKIAAKDIFKLNGHAFPYSSEALKTNSVMPLVTLEKIKKHFNNSLKNKRILLMGISYREDVGDTRFSPSEVFFLNAIKEGATVIPNDPLVNFWAEREIEIDNKIPNAELFDAIVFAVRHKIYSKINFKRWLKFNVKYLVVDANNVLSEKQRHTIVEMGNRLISIGRGNL